MKTLLRLGPLLLVLGCLVPAAEGGPQPAESRAAVVAAGAPRILYASDWSGTSQIYAVDPSGRGATGQLTFGRAPACRPGNPCGFATPVPSPDGRRILFRDSALQGPFRWNLFASLADGRERRQLGTLRGYPYEAVWAPDSRRIAYTSRDGIHVAEADGSSDGRVRRNGADQGPSWSADGRLLAFVNSREAQGGAETLHVWRKGKITTVARSEGYGLGFSWSPVGDRLAYASHGRLYVARPPAYAEWRLAKTASSYAWSPDGRVLAFVDPGGVKLAHVAERSVRLLTTEFAAELAWSPDARLLAYARGKGSIRIVDAATGRGRDLGSAVGRGLMWSPDGRLLAYIGGDGGIRLAVAATGAIRDLDSSGAVLGPAWSPDSRSLAYRVATGAETDRIGAFDIRIATVSGATRTVVAGAGTLGGAIEEFAWTRPPTTVHYRRPASRQLATITPDRLVAPWPIESLASDGGRVAYTACGHVFVWTPSAAEVVQREATASLSPACSSPSYYTSYHLYSLALAGDRVAYGSVYGGNGRVWWLGGTRGAGDKPFTLGRGFSTNGLAYSGDVVGDLTGSGDLLAFSSWKETLGPDSGSTATTAQEVLRALPAGCPCPTIASSPGPLVPFDVDGGRVLAGGDNETWLLDANGTRLLSIPVSAQAAQLSGRDLVVVRRGELRHYDAASGALRHVWSLPDVATGSECASPNPNRCSHELLIEDAARGLVTYVLDGGVHVLRLADGAGGVVASGTRARFLDTGLVYVDGARLELVSFDELPLS